MSVPPEVAAALLSLAGAATKAADQVEDEGLWFPWAGPPLGLLFGILMGLSAWAGGDFSALVTAVAVAVTLAGKVDAPSHRVGLAALMTLVPLAPGEPDVPSLAVLSAAAYLDEPLSDAADRGEAPAAAAALMRARPVLKAALALLLIAGAVSPWAALGGWGFDACYLAAGRLLGRDRPGRARG